MYDIFVIFPLQVEIYSLKVLQTYLYLVMENDNRRTGCQIKRTRSHD